MSNIYYNTTTVKRLTSLKSVRTGSKTNTSANSPLRKALAFKQGAQGTKGRQNERQQHAPRPRARRQSLGPLFLRADLLPCAPLLLRWRFTMTSRDSPTKRSPCFFFERDAPQSPTLRNPVCHSPTTGLVGIILTNVCCSTWALIRPHAPARIHGKTSRACPAIHAFALAHRMAPRVVSAAVHSRLTVGPCRRGGSQSARLRTPRAVPEQRPLLAALSRSAVATGRCSTTSPTAACFCRTRRIAS